MRAAECQNPLHAAVSAGLTIAATVTFALFAQFILIQACGPQFTADISPNWPLARLTVATAVSFALLAQPVLIFAGEPQLFTLSAASADPAVIDSDSARSDLDGL
jgi:hypothetical protein